MPLRPLILAIALAFGTPMTACAQPQTATGYAIAAMRMAELPPDIIQQVVAEMRVMIDKYSPAEAAQIATSSPY